MKESNDECRCDLWHYLGGFLWFLAAIAFIFAWLTSYENSILGFDSGFWFGNALILGILAIPLKIKGFCSSIVCKSR